MILATRRNNTRDGELIIVSHDHERAVSARAIAPTLQAALDQWSKTSPRLEALSESLQHGKCKDSFPLRIGNLHAPLPRAFAWLDGSSYLNHVILARKARGAETPPGLSTDPLMYQGGSDVFLGPTDDIALENEEWGMDFESELAVITDDVPSGTTPEEALRHIKLITLTNDLSLRNLIPAELAKGFGFVQSKPASSFAPFAVTPDELGSDWRDGRVHLPLETWLNGTQVGHPDAGPEMHFSFPQLIAHAAKTRRLGAGTIVGSGTVSNEDPSRGYSCIAEKRMREKLETGSPGTPFLKAGDHVRIEMFRNGKSVFGVISQKVSNRCR